MKPVISMIFCQLMVAGFGRPVVPLVKMSKAMSRRTALLDESGSRTLSVSMIFSSSVASKKTVCTGPFPSRAFAESSVSVMSLVKRGLTF